MDTREKQKIAFCMTTRASQAVKFVKDYLAPRLNDIDEPWLRWLYILLSFAFELILKSRVVMLSNASDINKLTNELKSHSHDFAKISSKLGQAELNTVGIKSVILNSINSKYIVETTSGKKFYVEDFNDIRYDFMSKKMRFVPSDEHKKINDSAEIMLGISNKMQEVNNKSKS